MADTYGTDFSTFRQLAPDAEPGLDLDLRVQGGDRVLAEDLARALQTVPGSLWWAPERGYDLRAAVGKPMTPAQRFDLVSAVRAEVLRDERVLTVRVSGTADPAARRIRLVLHGDGAAGPFRFVMVASEFDVSLVES